LHSKLQPNRCR